VKITEAWRSNEDRLQTSAADQHLQRLLISRNA
jgi:hypothetical protein